MTKDMVFNMAQKIIELEKLNPLKLAEYKGRLDAVYEFEISQSSNLESVKNE